MTSLSRTARLIEATNPEPWGETFRRYWSDPVFAAQIDAETVANRARANAAIDEGIARARLRKAPDPEPDIGERELGNQITGGLS